MNTNNKYVYIIMYDVPTVEDTKPYQYFRKQILALGGMMLQESVYTIHVNNKCTAKHIKNQLAVIAPEGSNVRGVMITSEMFENIDIISGELSIGEKVISKKYRVIEF